MSSAPTCPECETPLDAAAVCRRCGGSLRYGAAVLQGKIGARSCPVCPDRRLFVTVVDGVELDVCPTCAGVWYDAGELSLLDGGDPTDPEDGTRLDPPAGLPAAGCPVCAAPMHPLALDVPPGVRVERCERHGTWAGARAVAAIRKLDAAPDQDATVAHHRGEAVLGIVQAIFCVFR